MKMLAVAVAAVLITSSAYAQGVTLVMRETAAGQAGAGTTSQMQMDRTHVRVEARTDNGRNAAFIYDGPAKVVRMVDYDQKSYREISEAQMQQMGQQLSGAMAAMQEQLKNLPPEQRKMMEDMMKGRGGMPGMPAAAPARPTYKHVGSDRVGQWSCTKYEGYRGAEKIAEVCAAEPAVLGLTGADFDAVKQLAEVIKSMIPQALDQIAINGTVEDQGFNGFPIRRVSFQNGKPVSTTELTDLRREAIPPSAFAAPAGFRREAMPGGR